MEDFRKGVDGIMCQKNAYEIASSNMNLTSCAQECESEEHCQGFSIGNRDGNTCHLFRNVIDCVDDWAENGMVKEKDVTLYMKKEDIFACYYDMGMKGKFVSDKEYDEVDVSEEVLNRVKETKNITEDIIENICENHKDRNNRDFFFQHRKNETSVCGFFKTSLTEEDREMNKDNVGNLDMGAKMGSVCFTLHI